MTKARIFLTIGVWIAILPFLGFTNTTKNILFVITGLVIVYFSYGMYQNAKISEKKDDKSFDSFSENNNPDKEEEKIKI